MLHMSESDRKWRGQSLANQMPVPVLHEHRANRATKEWLTLAWRFSEAVQYFVLGRVILGYILGLQELG